MTVKDAKFTALLEIAKARSAVVVAIAGRGILSGKAWDSHVKREKYRWDAVFEYLEKWEKDQVWDMSSS